MNLNLNFDNLFIRSFPEHQTNSPTTPQLVTNALFCKALPTKVSNPKMLLWSNDVYKLLQSTNDTLANSDLDLEFNELEKIFSGNNLIDEMFPYATRYGGHQFGAWADQLGDGRAISIGEVINYLNQRWELQLKGAGKTAFSRHADGRAVLRSSVREFICSEAMHYLDVPTTRALCCVTTGEKVTRDMFYDGNPKPEDGAIVTRVSPTFIRFGHFEILANYDEFKLLENLIKYTIINYTPELSDQLKTHPTLAISNWFASVCSKTLQMVLDWKRVGFVHGVMNTDNMSILGLTIDYGPFGWMDIYDPEWTPNTTDKQHKRYRFSYQPSIAFWNLQCLASSILTIVKDKSLLDTHLEEFKNSAKIEFPKMMAKKLGLINFNYSNLEDIELLKDLDTAMKSVEIDMTIFFRLLSKTISLDLVTEENIFKTISDSIYDQTLLYTDCKVLVNWLIRYHQRHQLETVSILERIDLMNKNNPVFIPRNYLLQEALEDLETNDRTLLDEIYQALKTPYQETPLTLKFFKRMPDWARSKAGCSMLSCSS